MPYASFNDVVLSYKPIISLIGSADTDVATLEVSSVYVARAEGLIDGYLAARYVTPISPAVPLITQIASDLSIFYILAEHGGQTPEWMDKRYERCLKTLEMLRDGKMTLSSSVSRISSGDDYAYSPGQGYHPVFSPVLGELDQSADYDRQVVEKDQRATDPGQDSLCP